MSHQHVSYLLVGGGVASTAAAVAIRGVDPAGSLMLLGQEISRPYDRSTLSKDYLQHLARHDPTTPPFVLDGGWFVENRVQLKTNLRVERLDVNRRSALLANGTDVSYDALLLATGAVSRRLNLPGDELPNVFSLRTLADAERIARAIEQARREGMRFEGGRQVQGGLGAAGISGEVNPHRTGRGRAVVIGGGVLGVELAGSIAAAGLVVELIVGSEFPWHRFAGPVVARVVSDHLQQRGVRLHPGRRATAVEGDGRVQRVRLDDQTTVPCDFVVAAVGCTPNRELLRGTPVAAESAILTDDACRTNVPGVFAAGDCAACFDPRFGKHRMIDHTDHAAAAGRIAGSNMAAWVRGGHVAEMQRLANTDPWTTSTAGLTATIAGEPRAVDRRILRRSGGVGGERGTLVEIGIGADGRIAQVLTIDAPAEEQAAAMELLAERFDTRGREEQLRDVTRRLAELSE